MFVSINKKILYSLIILLLLLVAIFSGLFINFYVTQMQDIKQSVYMRNKYVVRLLQDNVTLQNELAGMGKSYPEISSQLSVKNLDDAQKQLSNAQKLNAELRQNYDDNREAIETGAKIVVFSLCIVIMFILLLIALLDYWVVRPIDRLTDISRKVAQGDYSSRLDALKTPLLRDEFDILNHAFNTMLDKTENNIKEIQQREHFLQQLIDAIPDGIRVINREGKVIMANKAFYTMLNLRQNCVGKKCFCAYGYRNEECPESKYNCPLRYLAQNKNGFLRTIHEINKKPFYLNAASLKFAEDNNTDYIVESLHDLSSDVRFSHQQKVSSLSFLSTSIAHEMKNNLGAVRLILEGLLDNEFKDAEDNSSPKKYLLMVQKQLIEAIKTPERLLRLSQYSEQDIVEINILSAVSDMVMMIDYDAKRHGVAVKTKIANTLKIKDNEADFKMIILNLLQNAIKAMPNGGLLQISGIQRGKNIVIDIEDTGIGIEKQNLKRIFEPFYSGNDQNKSSGLGLAIVRSLIAKSGGSISVKSKKDQGTIFTIKLPAAK
jgi:signal transduction histidine kinase